MILLFLLNYVIVTVLGFSAGVPPLRSVCNNMIPQHDTYKPQSTPAPFIISTNVDSISSGMALTGNVKSHNGFNVNAYMQIFI